MSKKKTNKNIGLIWGTLVGILIFIAAIVIISIESVPQEYKDALASLQKYNQSGCSVLDQTVKQEYYAKSKLEECFAQDNYSSEAKAYAWRTANIDFDAKAVRLVQDFINSTGRIVGNTDAAIKATKMSREELKAEWSKNYGYTTQQLDNAFDKVLGQ